MTSPVQSVWIENDGPVATITLNRPETLNAFDKELAARLDAALRTVERDDAIRAVILTGEGRAFSAGQDVKELAREEEERGPAAVGDQLRDRFNPIVIRLRAIEKPVVCAINGTITGAGLGIALACDLRIASDATTFVISPIGIGLIPGVGSTALLPALLGLGRASELAFLGLRIDAARALELGLVNTVVAASDLPAEAMQLAIRLAALPTRTIALTKRAFNRAVLPDLREHLKYEASLQEIAAGTDDHREGLAAILEKRSPMFTGH